MTKGESQVITNYAIRIIEIGWNRVEIESLAPKWVGDFLFGDR